MSGSWNVGGLLGGGGVGRPVVEGREKILNRQGAKEEAVWEGAFCAAGRLPRWTFPGRV